MTETDWLEDWPARYQLVIEYGGHNDGLVVRHPRLIAFLCDGDSASRGHGDRRDVVVVPTPPTPDRTIP